MTRNVWRRTAFKSASGGVEVAQDDWTLLRPSGEPLARFYKVTGGPQRGRWYWTALFRPDGSVGITIWFSWLERRESNPRPPD
jgi:hypothetical protein